MDKADDQAQQAESASTRRVVNAERLIITKCYGGDYHRSTAACVSVDRSRLAFSASGGSVTACVPVDRSRLAARLIDHGLRSSGSTTACSTVEFRWTGHGLQLQHGCIIIVASRKSIGRADPMLDVS